MKSHIKSLLLALLVALCWQGVVSVHYDMRITLGVFNPDCSNRSTVLINGAFQPTFNVTQGDVLSINLINDLPENTSTLAEGISLHIHGLGFKGVPWFDGVSHLGHCPVPIGQNLTYTYLVTDPPGTYFFHDHSSGVFLFDGFFGVLIVNSKADDKKLYGYDIDVEPALLQEWWNIEGFGVLEVLLSNVTEPERRLTANGRRLHELTEARREKALALVQDHSRGLKIICEGIGDIDTGAFVAAPSTVLIGGQGIRDDCFMFRDTLGILTGSCAPQILRNETCGRKVFNVVANKKHRMRFVNAATAFIFTICIDQHPVTIFQVDARPVTPVTVDCFDVENGQRVDVILTANKTPDAYWITIKSHIPGRPNGYAVLMYDSAPSYAKEYNPSNKAAPQQECSSGASDTRTCKRYGPMTYTAHPGILGKDAMSVYGMEEVLAVPQKADRVLKFNVSQPILRENGQSHWALNNVVNIKNPPCENLQERLRTDTSWKTKYVLKLNAAKDGLEDPEAILPLFDNVSGITDPIIFLEQDQGVLKQPIAATYVAEVKLGEVVDLVVQNNNGAAFNAVYGSKEINRSTDSHPMHLHGFHVWDIGHGKGTWTPASAATYNLKNPAVRDTSAVEKGGWMVARFLADSPGVWFFHCHTAGHHAMGLGVLIAVSPEKAPAAPSTLPKCKAQCMSALYNPSATVPSPPADALAPSADVKSTNKPNAAVSLHTFSLGLIGFVMMALMVVA